MRDGIALRGAREQQFLGVERVAGERSGIDQFEGHGIEWKSGRDAGMVARNREKRARIRNQASLAATCSFNNALTSFAFSIWLM